MTKDNDIGKITKLKHIHVFMTALTSSGIYKELNTNQGFKLRKLLEVAFKQLEVKFRHKMEKVSLKSNLLFHLQSNVVGILGLTQFFSVAKPKKLVVFVTVC